MNLTILVLASFCVCSSAKLYNCRELFEGRHDVITEAKWMIMERHIPHAGLSVKAGSQWYSIAESPDPEHQDVKIWQVWELFGAPSSYWCQVGQMPMQNFRANGYKNMSDMGNTYWDACFSASGSFITLGALYDFLVEYNLKKTLWSSLRIASWGNNCNEMTTPSTNCLYTATYLFRRIANSTLAEHKTQKPAIDVCSWAVPKDCLGPETSSSSSSLLV